MSFSFGKDSFEKKISDVLKLPSIEIVPNSNCSKQEILQFSNKLILATDFLYFLERYGAVREKHGSFSTLSLKGPENIVSFINELRQFYQVPDSIIPFYYVGSDCLCFDTNYEYGEPYCIKAWNHELNKPICPDDGITLFVRDADVKFQISSFSDFIEAVVKSNNFPGIGI